MHSVSDLNLALAWVDAGIVPSFIPSAYSSFEQFAQDYIKFNELTNFAQCVITLEYELLNSPDYNNTTGLQQGLVTGSSGHIYLGNAIDTIDSVKSLREIVKGLVD